MWELLSERYVPCSVALSCLQAAEVEHQTGDSEIGSCAWMLELCVVDEFKEEEKRFSSFWDYSSMIVLCLWKSWM